MILARLRRCAWVLLLALFTGVGLPLLASAAPGRQAGPGEHATVVHVHAGGSVHSHAAPGKAPAPGAGLADSDGKPAHCPCCLTDAACALSCFGLAVLPAAVDWMPLPTATAWLPTMARLPPGVVPSNDLAPPRPVSVR